ncbi:MAG: hypothetical protein FWD79_10605 [Desulfobulbus sp.]|nr:hypothetical protein [Desulfobulbus sp.]
MIAITIDEAKMDEAMQRLGKVQWAMQRAILPAVHEMMRGVADQLAEHLESDVSLIRKTTRDAVKVLGVRLEGDKVTGEVRVRSQHIPLIAYDVDPADITARPGFSARNWPGFTYSLRTGERRRSENRIKGASLPFIARMPGGHVGVYYRPGHKAGSTFKRGLWSKGRRGVKDHDAIKQDYGPDVQYYVATPEVEEAVIARTAVDFPAILARHVDRVITQFGGGE